LSIGTNLPELSLALKSVILGKKDVAFGDFIGSGATNAFLFGILTLIYAEDIVIENNFGGTFVIIALGLLTFFFFTRSKNDISRKEGFILILFYIAFVAFESLI